MKVRIRTIVLGIFLQEDRLLVFRGRRSGAGMLSSTARLGGGIEFGEYGHQALSVRSAKNWAPR